MPYISLIITWDYYAVLKPDEKKNNNNRESFFHYFVLLGLLLSSSNLIFDLGLNVNNNNHYIKKSLLKSYKNLIKTTHKTSVKYS